MLLDSNVFILAGKPTHSKLASRIQSLAAAGPTYASAITLVEVMGFHRMGIAEQLEQENCFKA